MLFNKKLVNFYIVALLTFCISFIVNAEVSKQDSFDAIRQKLIEKREERNNKGRGIDADYEEKILKKPFIKCLNSKEPLRKGSFISKMLKDRRFYSRCIDMLIAYVKDEHNPPNKRQYIFNVILRNLKRNTRTASVVYGRTILSCFNDKKYYNKESQEIIMAYLSPENKQDKEARDLFLIDLAGIYDNPQIKKYLKQQAAICTINNFSKAPGCALLILGRHGDKEAIEKSIKITNELIKKKYKFMSPMRLAYIIQPEIVELLREFLKSNLSSFNGRDCIPQRSSVSHSAACALSAMIVNYPKLNRWGEYPDEKRKECIEWFDKHKEYKFNENFNFDLY